VRQFDLPFSVPFCGAVYRQITVLPGPMVYLGEDIREDGWGGFRPQPAIAPLLMDTEPERGDGLFVDLRPERLLVTWLRVPQRGSSNTNTIQLAITTAGVIDFSYRDVDPEPGYRATKFHERTTANLHARDPGAPREGAVWPLPPRLVGIHPGGRDPPLTPIRFMSDLPISTDGPAVLFEDYDADYNRYLHRRLAPLAVVVLSSCVLILFVMPVLLRSSLIRPLNDLRDGMRKAEAGDMDVVVPPRFDDEVGYITGVFNQMLRSIKRIEAQRAQAEELAGLQQRRLFRYDKLISIGTLAAGVAHDIGNANQPLLTAASSLRRIERQVTRLVVEHWDEADLIGGLTKPEFIREFPKWLDNAETSAQMIDEVTNTLRNFWAEEPGLKRTEINQVVEAAIEMTRSQIRRTTDFFSFHPCPDSAMVFANVQFLRQVFVNLILNACHALPDRSRSISIRADCEPAVKLVRVHVADQGVGIPAHDLPRVTEFLFTTRGDHGGSGLGLFVADAIVREFGGTLTFQSKVNVGTTAVVTLPLESL
jgi:signal transduction histidine kinase